MEIKIIKKEILGNTNIFTIAIDKDNFSKDYTVYIPDSYSEEQTKLEIISWVSNNIKIDSKDTIHTFFSNFELSLKQKLINEIKQLDYELCKLIVSIKEDNELLSISNTFDMNSYIIEKKNRFAAKFQEYQTKYNLLKSKKAELETLE